MLKLRHEFLFLFFNYDLLFVHNLYMVMSPLILQCFLLSHSSKNRVQRDWLVVPYFKKVTAFFLSFWVDNRIGNEIATFKHWGSNRISNKNIAYPQALKHTHLLILEANPYLIYENQLNTSSYPYELLIREKAEKEHKTRESSTNLEYLILGSFFLES